MTPPKLRKNWHLDSKACCVMSTPFPSTLRPDMKVVRQIAKEHCSSKKCWSRLASHARSACDVGLIFKLVAASWLAAWFLKDYLSWVFNCDLLPTRKI